MTDQRELFHANTLGIKNSIEDVIEDFELLEEWEERYAYIIDLGKQLPAFPEEEKREENYIHGCQSQVWFIYHHEADDNRLLLLIESDAMIVRGLAAIILVAFNGKTPKELLDTDIDAIFQRLDLLRHVSATRSNGLRPMVARIQGVAEALA